MAARRAGGCAQSGRARPRGPVPPRRHEAGPTRREKLTAEEVKAIEDVPLTDPALAEARGLWVLALYAGCMRFSDVATLRRGNVSRPPDGAFRIAYRMKKMKRLPSLPVTGPGADVLASHWDRRGLETAGPDALVFPLLDGYDLTDAKKAFGAVSSQNAMTNERLKAVQKAAEAHLGRPFPAALTFHLARHSLAGRLLEAGWDVYDIRAVLGHASVRVTEEYLMGFWRPDLNRLSIALLRSSSEPIIPSLSRDIDPSIQSVEIPPFRFASFGMTLEWSFSTEQSNRPSEWGQITHSRAALLLTLAVHRR
ncbi:MAG TPA: tyrosine-type recombinase/integrase [Rubricoccaceae bacterium]